MSWKCGSQPAPIAASSSSRASAITAQLCSRFAWVTMTPLGSLVEPDVYCRKAIVSPVSSGICQSPGSPSGSASVATNVTRSASPLSAAHAVSVASDASVVSTRPMSASSNIPTVRCMLLASCGSGAGTATTPAYRQPRNAGRKSIASACRSRTGRSRSGRVASQAAIARASRSSSSYVTTSSTSSRPTPRR